MAAGDHIALIKQAVEDFLLTELQAVEPAVPVTFQGTTYEEPAGDWLHVNVAHNLDKRVALNAPEYKGLGIVCVHAMVPQRTGKLRVQQLAGRVQGILADRQIPAVAEGIKSVTFFNTKYREFGVVAGRETIEVAVEYRAFFLLERPA